jgi:hypothetical protein
VPDGWDKKKENGEVTVNLNQNTSYVEFRENELVIVPALSVKAIEKVANELPHNTPSGKSSTFPDKAKHGSSGGEA